MCVGVGVRLRLPVCLSVTTLEATYLVFKSQMRYYRFAYGVIKILMERDFPCLKTLRSNGEFSKESANQEIVHVG